MGALVQLNNKEAQGKAQITWIDAEFVELCWVWHLTHGGASAGFHVLRWCLRGPVLFSPRVEGVGMGYSGRGQAALNRGHGRWAGLRLRERDA